VEARTLTDLKASILAVLRQWDRRGYWVWSRANLERELRRAVPLLTLSHPTTRKALQALEAEGHIRLYHGPWIFLEVLEEAKRNSESPKGENDGES
jgi:hypothetical protein